MVYVLMLVFYSGYGPRPAVVMHDFNSQKACIAAAKEMRYQWETSSNKGQFITAVCMPKE